MPDGGQGRAHHMVPLVHDAVRCRGHHEAPSSIVYQSKGQCVLCNEVITEVTKNAAENQNKTNSKG